MHSVPPAPASSILARSYFVLDDCSQRKFAGARGSFHQCHGALVPARSAPRCPRSLPDAQRSPDAAARARIPPLASTCNRYWIGILVRRVAPGRPAPRIPSGRSGVCKPQVRRSSRRRKSSPLSRRITKPHLVAAGGIHGSVKCPSASESSKARARSDRPSRCASSTSSPAGSSNRAGHLQRLCVPLETTCRAFAPLPRVIQQRTRRREARRKTKLARFSSAVGSCTTCRPDIRARPRLPPLNDGH